MDMINSNHFKVSHAISSNHLKVSDMINSNPFKVLDMINFNQRYKYGDNILIKYSKATFTLIINCYTLAHDYPLITFMDKHDL